MASTQSSSSSSSQSLPAVVDPPVHQAQSEPQGPSTSPPPTRPQFSPPSLELSLADLDDLKSSLGLPLSPTSPIMPGMRASSASPPPLSAPGGDPSWGAIEHRPYATLPARSTSAPPTPIPTSATDDLAPHFRHDMQLTDSAVQRVRRRKSYRESVSVLSLKRNQSTGQSQVVISPVDDTDEEHEVIPIPEEPSEDGQQPPKPIHRTTLKRNLRTRPLRRPNSPALGAPANDEGGTGGPSPPRNRNRDSTGSLHRRRSHPRTSFDGVVPDMDAGPKSPTSPTSPIAVTAESLALPLPPVIPPVLGLVTPAIEQRASEMDERIENDLAFEDSVLANYVVPPERSSSLRSRARVRPSVDTSKKDRRTPAPVSPMSPTSPTSPPPLPLIAVHTKPSPVKSPPIIPPTLPPLSFDASLATPILKSPPPSGPSLSTAPEPHQQQQHQSPAPPANTSTLHTTTVLAPLQIPPRVASVTSASTLLKDEKPHAVQTALHTQPNQQPLTIPSLTGTPAKDPADGVQPVRPPVAPVPTPDALPLKPDHPPAKPTTVLAQAPASEQQHPQTIAEDPVVGRPRSGSNASLSSIDGVDAASTMSGSSSMTDKSPPLAKKKKGLFNFGKKKKDDATGVDQAVSAATASSTSTTNGMVGGEAAGDYGVQPAPKMKKSSSWGWLFSSSSSSSSHKKVTPADAMTAVAALDAEDTAAASGPPGKKKEKSLVASLFKSGSSSSTAKRAANGAAGANTTATGRAAGGLVGTPGGAGAHKYSNYAQRYPIHIERAICRLAHAKLANPRHPLHHQVLISNMLVWYMSLRKAEEEAAAQAALNGAAAAANANGNASASGGESSGDEGQKAIVWKGGRFQSNLGGKGKRRRKGGSPRRAGQGARSAEMVVASPSYSSGSAGGAGASPRWPEQDGYTSDGRGGVGAPGGRKKGGRAGGRRRKRRGQAEGNSSSESDSSDEEDEDEDDLDDLEEDKSVIEAPATPKLNGVSGPPLPASGTSAVPVAAATAATADDEDDDVPLGLVMQKKPDAVKS
ncbi:hypothetical protein BCR44DRAFT_1441766 [Catenaria anguillulae PL171]|uniref:Protein Zds1 C-terminal domain-containing protein n=1 Tax=Catenaria anguillulae PL171 TaxID=765915 RepID=A0A1Y2HCJ3_9FUNG|nr:hypothetical protein BCR44DRAFT_1441766 [Catenaria anguillulae PL171]